MPSPSLRLHANLGFGDLELRARRNAERRAVLKQQGSPSRQHALRGDQKVRRRAGRTARARQSAVGDRVRRLQRDRELAVHLHARIDRGRLGLPDVRANHGRLFMHQEPGHQTRTSSAPSLMVTFGPSILTVPPFPSSISMASDVTEIFGPNDVVRKMPPEPGVSSRTMLWPPAVLMTTF